MSTDYTAEDQARHRRQIAESSHLMEEARKILKNLPKQTEILQKDPKQSIPFQLQTPENAETAPTPAPPSPTRPSGGDVDTQARLRQLLSQRLSKMNSETGTSTLTIELPPPTVTEPTDQPAEQEQEEPEKEEKPYLKDPEVITEEIAKTEEIYLSPSDVTYPIAKENPDAFIPRNIVEEGHWVPDIPFHKPLNVYRIENRLLWADPDRQQYFGADGHVKHETPGVNEIPPPFPVEPPNHDGVGLIEFRMAQKDDVQEQTITRGMIIEIKNVKFLVHSLSSPEDIAAARLEMAYNAYTNNLTADKSNYYKKRWRALIAQLAIDDTDEKKKDTLTKLIECYDMYDREGAFSGSLRDEVIKVSHELKDARNLANYTSTPCHLRWQKCSQKPEEIEREQAKLDAFINERALKIVQLEELEGRQADVNQIIYEIKERRKNLCLRQPGDPEWNAVFTMDMPITPNDQVPVDEQDRRNNITKTQIMLRIIIPNQTEIKTNYVKLSNSFESVFNKTIELKTTRLSPSIVVEICELDYRKKSKVVARLTIPVYVGEPPDYYSYEFTSDYQLENGKLIMGTVDARAYIRPDENQEIIVTIPDSNTKTKKRLVTDPSQFVSIPKVLEDVKKMDQNDPYITSNLSTLLSNRAKERVGEKFRLDALADSVKFNAFVPQSVNFQQQLKLQRILDERARQKRKEADQTGDKYLQNLKENQVVQSTVVREPLTLTDIVGEAPMPTLPSLLSAIAARLFMYRPLKPPRKERIPSSNVQTYSKIIIHLIRGMNIPQRTKLSTGPNTDPSLIYSSTIDTTTNVMARITYDDEVQKTYPVAGASPEWNQRFMFNVTKEKNEIPSVSELEKKEVRIDLFDHVVFNVVEDDRQTQTTHAHIEERYLGGIIFPVGAVWASGKVDGAITLETSPFILGYAQDPEPIKLSVFFTIDPPMKLIPRVNERESAESIEVKLRAEKWINMMRNNAVTKTRNVKLMANPTNGMPILICRMITPQNLPEGFTNQDRNKIARFVSLFPNVSDNSIFGSLDDVWCTSQQFLNLKAGDEEEHASLLCNYFKYMGLDAYVVFGYSIDHGNIAYVLTKEAGQLTLWDPLTGHHYNAKDRFCPLYSVGCILNETNVWANVQSSEEPWKIDWNLSNTGLWHPFFSSSFPLTSFDTPQETTLKYLPQESGLLSLEREIEVSIKTAVERARDQQRTIWNRDFGLLLRRALEQCERAVASNTNEHFDGIIDDLTRSYPSYRMYGTPFCVAFKDVDHVVQEVKIQECYLTENPNTEFALSVYVVPYPNQLKAVWVMLALIENIRPGGNRL